MPETTQAQAPVESTPTTSALESTLESLFAGQPEDVPPKAPEAAEEVSADPPDGELEADDLPEVEGDDAPKKEAGTDETFDIIHNGQQIKLTRAEVIANAQKGFDYDRKVQAATETHKAFQAGLQRLQELEQVQPLLAQEMGQVAALQMRLRDERFSDSEMLKLAQAGDLLEYQQRDAERTLLRNQYQNVAGQLQQKASAVQQYRAQLMESQLQQEAARLPEVIPAWKDPAKASADKADIAKYLQDLGVDMSSVGRYLDNAFSMKIARDAMLYQRLSRLKADKSKQLRAAPPVVKPGAMAPSDQGKAVFAKARTEIRAAGKQGNTNRQEKLMEGLLNRTFK